MIIELLKDIRHEGGKVFKKGTRLNVHPTFGNELIKKNKAFDTEQIKIKEDGNSRKDKRS
jgi:hypothetical protein